MQWNPCENHLLKDKKKGVQYKKYYFLYYFFKNNECINFILNFF